MSDIKVGDLVIVVRVALCCGNAKSLGKIFKTGEHYSGIAVCPRCGNKDPVNGFFDANQYAVYETSRLKKIPPLTEPKTTEHRDEVKA